MPTLQQLKQQVADQIREGIALAEAHYHITLAYPNVIYKKRGSTAGTASYRKWEIDLNEALLVREGDAFIIRTPKHELAHLITGRVYPETNETTIIRTRRGRLKRSKRDIHGPSWQEVMRVIGIADPTRCHQYDVEGIARKRSTHSYSCGCKTWDVGPKRHKKIQLASAIGAKCPYRCPSCKGSLTLVGAITKPATSNIINDEAPGMIRELAIRRAAAAVGARTGVQFATPGVGSMFTTKLAMARHIMNFSRGKTRDQIIAEMVNEAGCTLAGASTYYFKIRKELGF